MRLLMGAGVRLMGGPVPQLLSRSKLIFYDNLALQAHTESGSPSPLLTGKILAPRHGNAVGSWGRRVRESSRMLSHSSLAQETG
jgi:hypothetical protein